MTDFIVKFDATNTTHRSGFAVATQQQVLSIEAEDIDSAVAQVWESYPNKTFTIYQSVGKVTPKVTYTLDSV